MLINHVLQQKVQNEVHFFQLACCLKKSNVMSVVKIELQYIHAQLLQATGLGKDFRTFGKILPCIKESQLTSYSVTHFFSPSPRKCSQIPIQSNDNMMIQLNPQCIYLTREWSDYMIWQQDRAGGFHLIGNQGKKKKSDSIIQIFIFSNGAVTV